MKKDLCLKVIAVVSAAFLVFSAAACGKGKRGTPAKEYAAIMFFANGGTGESYTQEIEKNTSSDLDANRFSRVGYDFSAWNTKSDGTGTEYAGGAEFQAGDTGVSLYARWRAKNYTVTYKANGGDGADVSQTATYDVSFTLEPADTFSRVGYNFTAWGTESGGSGTAYTAGQSTAYNTAGNLTLYALWAAEPETHTVSFVTNVNGLSVEPQSVLDGGNATEPDAERDDGYILAGWYSDPELENIFDFSASAITGDITLYAKWRLAVNEEITAAGAFNESLYAEWNDDDAESAAVFVKEDGAAVWEEVPGELVREIGEGKARADAVGLKAGTYDVKIVTSGEEELMAERIEVEAYDRSGYAHFKLNEEPVCADGIGAYKNDGTLKDDAIVVYVTEENKNDTVIINPDTNLPVHSGQTGIGWLLNNNQYQGNDRAASLAALDVPLCIRIIGTVTPPEGLTAYNSTVNGGSVGDNGFMARIRDGKNITIEGVGEGAQIFGWGIHFIAAQAGRGIGFEVRNLTFDKYPEDALGMEGVVENGTLAVPVQRCWIHHNTFKTGYCANPAESDKAYGDGSCDFKRGMYYTLSYCVFDGGEKTNLIGSGSGDLQYHVTLHHNEWKNCRSRVPLLRVANIHMYNNYIHTDADRANDHVQSVRMGAFLFSEANYFFDSKDTTVFNDGGGTVKSFNEIKYSCWGTDVSVKAASRSETVSGSSHIYANFDTNPDIFYFKDGASDVTRLTDALTAKIDCMVLSGANRAGRTYEDAWEQAKVWPGTPEQVSDSESYPTGSVKSMPKGRPYRLFEIKVDAVFSFLDVPDATARRRPVLASIYGAPLLVGAGTVDLEPGIYSIEGESPHNTKNGSDAKLGGYSITLDGEAARQARIDTAKAAFAAIPVQIEYADAHLALLDAARAAYEELKSDGERAEVDYSDLTDAEADYIFAGITFVEGKIAAIGTVTAASLPAITEAREAYDKALQAIKSGIANYAVLTAAETAFESYAADAFRNAVNGLPSVSGITARTDAEDALEEYESVLSMYLGLNGGQREAVEGEYNILETGIAALEAVIAPYLVMDMIDAFPADITLSNGGVIVEAKDAFDALDTAQQAVVPTGYQDKLAAAYAEYFELSSQAVTHSFQYDGMSAHDGLSFAGDNLATSGKGSVTVGGVTYTTCLKINSNGKVTYVNGAAEKRITLYFNTAGGITSAKIKVNGTSVNVPAGGVFTMELSANVTYLFEKDSPEINLFYILIEPV